MISRSDCAFSQRCEQRSWLMSGRRPQASFKAGIEPEPIEVVAVRVAAVRSPTRSPHTIAERRDPSYVAHTVADLLGARRLARRWVPAFDAASEENGPHRTRLGFSYAKQMAGGSWVGYLLSWRATQDQRFAAKIPKQPKRGMPATAMFQLAERRRTKGSTQVKQSAPKK